MDLQLLALLSDGHFRSGEQLSALLGVSRATVRNRLERISSSSGLSIHRVSGKGYRLSRPITLLDRDRLGVALSEQGWHLRLLPEVDSTSAECRRQLSQSVGPPLLVIAEHQHDGRGRRGRVWVSPAFENITASLLLRVPPGLKDLPAISLVVAFAVCKSLEALGFQGVALKWPNDVYLSGKKVAGVLLELNGDPTDSCFLIIGIGLNVNQYLGSDVIDQAWTSLCLAAGSLQDRTDIAIVLFRHLSECLEDFFTQGFSAFRERWESLLLWRGQACSLVAGDTVITGDLLGLSETGELRLEIEGKERSYCAGELSLRVIR